jgi:hypothetical protein
MITLSAADLLCMWERAAAVNPGERALALAAGCSGLTTSAAFQLTVGDRDRRLIVAHRGLFGKRVTGRADCPACFEPLEVNLDLADFDLPASSVCKEFRVADCEVEWRMPTAGDMAVIARMSPPETARARLIRQCVTRVTHRNEEVHPAQWPQELVTALSQAVAAADPLADVQIGLTCVRCENRWSIGFDPSAFLWTEIDNLARRLLSEVHRLASAYHWREADILAMSAARRAAYLRMCE